MAKPKRISARPRARVMNPHVPLRAKTVQSKKKVAAKRACRERLDFSKDSC
jgi:hypothetical protein